MEDRLCTRKCGDCTFIKDIKEFKKFALSSKNGGFSKTCEKCLKRKLDYVYKRK